MSLATKWRPNTWEAVIGQDTTVSILKKQIETESIKNTYIFSGASGCGKTTVARIFAQAINDNTGTPIEIDAASNNGVDNIKEIVRNAGERSLDGKYKVFIIDEAHMLTTQAWNAFLKCIEEPPLFTIFIFCTTDPQKIPDTIKNRCMRFNFNRIPTHLIKRNLDIICDLEGLANYETATDIISNICNGEMRNGISMLEKCVDFSDNLSADAVLNCLGMFSYDLYFKLINNIIDGKVKESVEIIDSIYVDGTDLRLFVDKFLGFCIDITKYVLNNDIKATSIPNVYIDDVRRCVNIENAANYYYYFIDKLLELKLMIKQDTNIVNTVEVMIIKMCNLK